MFENMKWIKKEKSVLTIIVKTNRTLKNVFFDKLPWKQVFLYSFLFTKKKNLTSINWYSHKSEASVKQMTILSFHYYETLFVWYSIFPARQNANERFLGAYKHHYKRVCPSVRPSRLFKNEVLVGTYRALRLFSLVGQVTGPQSRRIKTTTIEKTRPNTRH